MQVLEYGHTHIPYKWTGCLVIGLGLVQLFYFLNVFPPMCHILLYTSHHRSFPAFFDYLDMIHLFPISFPSPVDLNLCVPLILCQFVAVTSCVFVSSVCFVFFGLFFPFSQLKELDFACSFLDLFARLPFVFNKYYWLHRLWLHLGPPLPRVPRTSLTCHIMKP